MCVGGGGGHIIFENGSEVELYLFVCRSRKKVTSSEQADSDENKAGGESK